jgi:hypothetical protein
MQIPAVKNPGEGDNYFAFIGAVGMYQSDFGVIEKIKDLDADPRYVLIEDPDYVEIRYLPGMDMNEYEIGKRGSGDEFAIESQFCFAVTLPQAMAAIVPATSRNLGASKEVAGGFRSGKAEQGPLAHPALVRADGEQGTGHVLLRRADGHPLRPGQAHRASRPGAQSPEPRNLEEGLADRQHAEASAADRPYPDGEILSAKASLPWRHEGHAEILEQLGPCQVAR